MDHYSSSNHTEDSPQRPNDPYQEDAYHTVKSYLIAQVAHAHSTFHKLAGIDTEALQRLQDAVGSSYHESMPLADYITDEMIDVFGMAGTPDEIIEKLCYFEKQGVKQYIFYAPFGPNIEEAFRLIQDVIIYMKQR